MYIVIKIFSSMFSGNKFWYRKASFQNFLYVSRQLKYSLLYARCILMYITLVYFRRYGN